MFTDDRRNEGGNGLNSVKFCGRQDKKRIAERNIIKIHHENYSNFLTNTNGFEVFDLN